MTTNISKYELQVDTAFSPPKVTVSPLVSNNGVWYVKGRSLMTPNNRPFRPVGVEVPTWKEDWYDPYQYITEVAAAGANTVRLLPYFNEPTPAGSGSGHTAGEIDQLIAFAASKGLLVDVAVDGGKRIDSWVAIKSILKLRENHSVVHAMGESYHDTVTAWVEDAKSTVRTLREAGYKQPLYIMSNDGGRNLPTILRHGQSVLDSDPLRSVVFGWQAYWGSSNYYHNKYAMTWASAFQAVSTSPLCIQVGIMEHTDPGKPETAPVNTLLSYLNFYNLGWLWWDWRLGPDSIGYGGYANTATALTVKGSGGLRKAVRY